MKTKRFLAMLLVATMTLCQLQLVSVAAATPAESDWSEWSTVRPETTATRIIETKTQYSYRTKETKSFNNASATYNGYTRDTSVSPTYGTWTSYSKTAATKTSILDVQTKTVVDSYTYTMAHYCTGNVTGAKYQTASSNNTTNATFNANCDYHSLGTYNSSSFSDYFTALETGYIYGTTTANAKRCANTCYRWYKVKTTSNTHTEYSTRPIYYTFYKWSDWSSYSDTYVAATSTKEVQTRTLYRYVDYTGTINMCTVSLPQTSFTYTGEACNPIPTVVNSDGVTLTSGVDYIVKYQENVNVGTAYVSVEGISEKYYGTQTLSFEIAKANPVLTFDKSEVTKRKNDTFTNPLNITTDGEVTYASSDPNVATVDEVTGEVTAKAMGNARITVVAAAGNNYKAGSAYYELTVIKAAPVLFFYDTEITINEGNRDQNTLSNAEGVDVVYNSSDSSVVSVDPFTGVITGIKAGTATITVEFIENKEVVSSDSYKVTVKSGSITDNEETDKKSNTIKASSITKTYSTSKQTVKLGATASGSAKLSYKSSSSSVQVSSSGTVTINAKFIGKATITITAAETASYKKTTKKITVTVNPKKPTISKVTSPSKGKVVTTWGKVSPITKYQIQFSKSKSFPDGAKTSKIRDVASSYTKSTLTGFPKGTMYVRLRTYKTVSGTKYYSSWSTVKSVSVK